MKLIDNLGIGNYLQFPRQKDVTLVINLAVGGCYFLPGP